MTLDEVAAVPAENHGRLDDLRVWADLTHMASKAQISGMRGVFLVAAELARIGLIVSPTSRSARGVDLLVTSADGTRAFSVEVKSATVAKRATARPQLGHDRGYPDAHPCKNLTVYATTGIAITH